ncbi:DUF2065 domain-containing protein [Falsiroseomonas sp. E2-1-a20]|uniref:DUF2065 domain-containing protein n=1 Tax=Falsiroseomonas sp. E2-1-a20 TaxID=3239300 RepID=UPI003F3ADF26
MQLGHVLAGVAVVLAVEGLAYAVFPGAMKRMLASLAATPEQRLRTGGLVAAVIGTGLAWMMVGAG